MNQAELQEWLTERRERDDRLYERYGRPLEPEHNGEFVAIGDNGRTLLGTDELEVAELAISQFGPGAFVLRKVGMRGADFRVLHSTK
jgi:hypothetical protein